MKMLQWQFFVFIKICATFLICCCLSTVQAGFLHSVLGIPTECIHQNVIMQCKLTFSCWLQGGIGVHGCGTNKWLFSCCVTEFDFKSIQFPSSKLIMPSQFLQNNLKFKNKLPAAAAVHHQQLLPKRKILRRRKDGDTNDIDDISNEILHNKFECGVPKTFQNSIQKRIIGGRPAKFAEYPWQAHIRIAEFQCGGVLVSRQFVATAAHCIQQARLDDIVVYLGELDTQNSGLITELLPAEKHRVLQKIIHPRFQFRMTQPDRFDLALLKLARSSGYSSHILPICLPSRPIELIGKKGLIAGWGKIAVNVGHSGTNIMQTASVPIISAADCIKWHQSKLINVELFTEMFCAGHSDGHQDACLGDSGGPLIVKERNHYTLIGIISAGFGCGVDHQPGIYHNVQKTSKWIQDVISRNS